MLGKSPSWQDAGGACSGYLIETDETKVLLDCGNGVFGKLREQIDYTEVDAVIISHLHADHFLDLVPYSYALTYAPRQQPVPVHTWEGTDDPARPRLVAPPGAIETFRRVVGAWGNDDLIENAFRIEEYERGDTVEIGDIRATFHAVPALHRDLRGPDQRRGQRRSHLRRRLPPGRRDRRDRPRHRPAVHRGDPAAARADRDPRPPHPGGGGRARAGEAGAKRVVITHISDELGDDWAREEAERASARRSRSPARAPSTRSERALPCRLTASATRSRTSPGCGGRWTSCWRLLGPGRATASAVRSRRSFPESTSTTAARAPEKAIVKVELPGSSWTR